MPSVTQQKRCQISPAKAFDIVKDFERYPEFLPWCSGARLQQTQILSDKRIRFIADLIIKYTIFTEVFTTSVICCSQQHHIDIDYLKGPFKYLKSYWRFHPVPDNPDAVDIEFMIDFEMKFSPIHRVIQIFFEDAMKKMISAFEARFIDYKK